MPVGNGGIIGPANIPTTSIARGVWSLKEAFLAQKQGIWPVPSYADPYFEYTTLLLPGNGTNGANNNTFLDGSTNNFTITRNGNTTQGTFSPFSQTGWGNYFNGSSTLSCSSNAKFGFGSGTYSIEAWVYKATTGSYKGIFTNGAIGNGTLNFYISNTETLVVDQYGSTGLATTATIPVGVWTHVLVTRDSATNGFRIFIDGVLRAYTTSTFNNTSTSCMVGNTYTNDTSYMVGYLSNVRVIKGSIPTSYQTSSTTVGTSIFTPSTAALTTSSQGATASDVSLLTCQSNRFRDASTNNFTVTPNGSPSVVAFSPFSPTASWSAATYGGSGYFDGNGDYLSVADNAALQFSGTTVFTLEAWVYPAAIGSSQGIISKRGSSGTQEWQLSISSSGAVLFGGNSGNLIGSTTLKTNSWSHIAASSDGTTVSIYLNGTRDGTAAASTLGITSLTNAVLLGYQTTSANPFTGYMASARVVKGTQVYSGTSYTVPTAPLTAITNTSLLLNFTNAGIYDATSKNDLETVGNAQISNGAGGGKWGGGSISFDGTGDWLLIPDQPPQRIGTGKFTIELWVYRNSSGTYGLVGKGTGTTGWLVSLNSSNQVVFTYASSTITSTGTVSATTWTHIAVVREGTSTNQTKIYINGTNDGTGTVSTDFNQTNSMYIGADRTGGSAANAYVQDVRITNDARYTANFTAPTAAFPTL